LIPLIPLILLLHSFQPARAQDDATQPERDSPATGHAQVIAHGVAVLPEGHYVWRVDESRAVPPHRAAADERPTGFVLAEDGVVALTNGRGRVLTRLAPGEAAWIGAEASRAVVSLQEDAVDYFQISLLPALWNARRAGEAVSTPFAVPLGEAFDVHLVRDVLERNEERAIAAGVAPALLLATRGDVFVTLTSGEVLALTAGQAAQVAGEVVVIGASRAPAAFVVARIGPAVPERVALRDLRRGAMLIPDDSPSPQASLTISAFICPAGFTGGSVQDCTEPAAGIAFALTSADEAQASLTADAAGLVDFGSGPPGDYVLTAILPGESASSRVSCPLSSGGDAVEQVAFNQAILSVPPGETVSCTWRLIPADVNGGLPVPGQGSSDTDGDRLTDERETELGTDPFLADSDGDGLSDGDEVDLYGADPLRADTDDDGLGDADEIVTTGTNPLLADSDGDGAPDAEEIAAGSDPIDAGSLPATPTPVPTSIPVSSPATPRSAAPATEATPEPAIAASPPPSPAFTDDLDGDGLTTADEVAVHGTNATVTDSDGDGIGDGEEIAAGTDPLDPEDR
jgi:hypothetical protein